MRNPETNLERLVRGWLCGLARGDLDTLRELIDPDMMWQGIREEFVCNGRDKVLLQLRDELERLPRVEALEVIAGEDSVVLGARSHDLTDVGEVPIPGQIFTVFRFCDGRIVRADDYVERAEALRAAGATEPSWC